MFRNNVTCIKIYNKYTYIYLFLSVHVKEQDYTMAQINSTGVGILFGKINCCRGGAGLGVPKSGPPE
jgi:hypothetical protein